MYNNISAIILAGGESKRFGGTFKPEIKVQGKTIISRMTGILDKIFNEIIIVTNSPSKFKDYENCKITGDIFKNAGPLGGLHAGMKASTKAALFAFAGDMPFLDSKLIISQVECFNKLSCDALVPKAGNEIEPLHAIYSTQLIDKLSHLLSEGSDHSLRDFLSLIKVENYCLPASAEIAKAFTNINSLEDLDNIC